MTRFLAFMAAALVAWPAFSAPSVSGPSSPKSAFSVNIVFPIGDTTQSQAIPVSGFCSVRYQQSGGDDASLYAVTTATTAAASGTLIKSFTSSTTAATTFTAGTRWVKAIATDATAGGSVMTIDCAPLTGGGGRGGDPDLDNDGQYDWAVLWDADGDGSVWQTCTAKDTPDPACKAAGERVYVDVADDLNCAIWDCGYGSMELTGTIYLEPGVYVNWPCYDYQQSAGYNARGPANDNLHDSTADAAWLHCPATPDPDTTRRFYTINLMDWQGEIIGAGTDTRDPSTTTGYIRDQGTYLVDDRGPDWEVGTNAGNNNWFGQASFIRGITFGFQGPHTASTSAGVASGESAGDGDSKGYGTVSGTQTIATIEDNAGICVANTSGLDTLVAGDHLIVYGQSGTLGGGSATVAFAARVMDTPSVSVCNGAGTIRVLLGGFYGYLGNNTSYAGGSIPYAFTFLNGNAVTAARSDYFDSSARISNMNIEPQDYWAEPSGDCSEQMDFADATERGWTAALDGDSTNADIDCDTNPLLGLYGGGAPVIEDVVIRSWHQYAIDGDSNAGYPLVRRTRFLYGRGGPILDAGTGWRMHDIEIRDTTFASLGISTYGPGLEGRDIRAINSSGESLINFTDVSVGNLFDNIKIEGGSILHALKFTCGARRNTIRNLTIEGTLGIGSSVSLSRNGTVAWFDCADTTVPIEQNVIDGFDTTGVRMAQQLAGNVTAAIALNTSPTIASPKSASIVRNHFTNGRIKATKSAYDACLFAAIDTDTTVAPNDRTGLTPDDFSHEDVLALNSFMGNSAESSGGGGGVAHVYCGCNVNAGGTPAGYGTCTATVGSGSGIGANARGCLNFDGTAAPSAGESCS
jgi:hypothetical protein